MVLIGAAFFGQRVNRNAILAFLVSYAGLALVFTRNLSTIGESDILRGTFVLADRNHVCGLPAFENDK